jgi:hypothetical protein
MCSSSQSEWHPSLPIVQHHISFLAARIQPKIESYRAAIRYWCPVRFRNWQKGVARNSSTFLLARGHFTVVAGVMQNPVQQVQKL